MDAAYAAISGPNGTIDKPRFRQIFTPTARLVMVQPDARTGSATAVMSSDDFFAAFDKLVGGKPFFETGKTVTLSAGTNVATILSDYESKSAPDGAPLETGRNSFLLVRTTDGWHVDCVFWEIASNR